MITKAVLSPCPVQHQASLPREMLLRCPPITHPDLEDAPGPPPIEPMWKQTSKRYPPKDHLRQSLLGLSLGLSLIALSSPVEAHATEELPSTAAEKAQQDQITFVILDAATREPIIGAVVRCVGATTPAMTDKNGRCTLRFKTAISSAQLDISWLPASH